jgi:hypothetical protein
LKTATAIMNTGTESGAYALATGAAAVRRLHLLHKIYSPAGRRGLLQAGLKEGMAGCRLRLRCRRDNSYARRDGGLFGKCDWHRCG